MSRPYVGILVNEELYKSIPLGRKSYEAIRFYLEAGQHYDTTPCFFRKQDVNLARRQVMAYVKQGGRFTRQRIPLPQVIHNRAIYPDHQSYLTLQAWTDRGVQLFNRWNRYGKLFVYELLMKDPSIRPHLPATHKATASSLQDMMGGFDCLIIKPNKSSIGRGVMKLERAEAGWELTHPSGMSLSSRVWHTHNFAQTIPGPLLRALKQRPYIVQQRLPLATFQGRPFDLRVSVQRGATGAWGVTGIVAKVASKRLFLTNVALGGRVHSLEEVLREYPHLDQSHVVQQIADFSLRVAAQLSCHLPHLADIGLDIGMTTDGFPMFIECNGKDQRYSFREAGMLDTWKSTYYTPMAYARYLLDGGKPL